MDGNHHSQAPQADLDLIEAAGDGDFIGIDKALMAGADPRRARDPDGATALMLAAHSRMESCVELLLPLSEPDAVDGHGWNALMCAIDARSVLCCRWLAPLTDLDHVDNAGLDALDLLDHPRGGVGPSSHWNPLRAMLGSRRERHALAEECQDPPKPAARPASL